MSFNTIHHIRSPENATYVILVWTSTYKASLTYVVFLLLKFPMSESLSSQPTKWRITPGPLENQTEYVEYQLNSLKKLCGNMILVRTRNHFSPPNLHES